MGPQVGPQTAIMACDADIGIFGGAAGGGKSGALLLDGGRWAPRVRNYEAVIFRRTYPQITNPMGLWDTSKLFYPQMGGVPRRHNLEWTWPKMGSRVKFGQLQYEDTVTEWMGSGFAFLGFDELTHFLRTQFIYLLSRLRSSCGVRPYARASCNPDSASWVAKYIAWWINQETGFPRPERVGVKRYMIQKGVDIEWGDGPDVFNGRRALSVTFIPAKITDNPKLLDFDPDYLSKMENLLPYEKATLLDGNWKVARTRGMLFKRSKFRIIDAVPGDVVEWIRYWDRAATEVTPSTPDPDWTSGVKMGRRRNGRYVVAHAHREQSHPSVVQASIVNYATQDGKNCTVGLEQDPGSAGVAEVSTLSKALAGWPIYINKVQTAKYTRATPFASQVNVENVDVVRGPWNDAFLEEHEAFIDEDQVDPPPGYHNDQVDGASGAFNFLTGGGNPIPSIRSLE